MGATIIKLLIVVIFGLFTGVAVYIYTVSFIFSIISGELAIAGACFVTDW